MKNNQLVIIGAVIVVGALLFSGLGGLQMLGLQALDTTTVNNPNIKFGTANMDGYAGYQAIIGTGEMTNRQSYISSWYGVGDSEVIHFTGKLQQQEYKWSGLPMNLIGKYGFKIYFNDLQIAGFDPVTGEGFYKADYMKPEDDYVSEGVDVNGGTWTPFDISKYDGADYHGETWWDAREQNPILDHNMINGGVSKEWIWITTDGMPTHWWTPTFITQTVLFHMIGPKVGTVKVEFYVEWQPIKHATWDTWSGGTTWQLVQTDQFSLQSGRGTISVLPIGNDGTDGSKPATGTDGTSLGTVYTKYHFQEGDEVQIQYQTGFSGQTSKSHPDTAVDTPYNQVQDGWTLQIWNPNIATGPMATYPLNDNVYSTIKFPIPAKAFVKGGSNDWKVILNNGINDQDELLLFVVDSRANLPPTPLITFIPEATPQVGKPLQVTATSGINENTQVAISYFTIIARYGASGTDYVAGFGTTNKIPATSTGAGTYTATKQMTPTKAGDIYVTATGTDADGRTSYVRERIIRPETPQNYVITFKVIDVSSNGVVQGASVKINYATETTDTEGRCSFSLQGGIYNIFITKSGYYDAKLEQRTIAGTQTITVTLYPTSGSPGSGEQPGAGEQPGGGVSGNNSLIVTVYDDSTWGAVSGAMVTVGDQSGITDSLGQVALAFTEAKEYTMTVTAKTYADYTNTVTLTQFQSGKTDAYMTLIKTEDVDGDGDTEEVESGKTVVVTVTDATTGVPILGALVNLGSASGLTDVSGMTTFREVTDGSCSINIQASGYTALSDTAIISGVPPVEMPYQLTSTTNTDDYSNKEDPSDQTPSSQKSTVTVAVTNGNANTIVKIDGATQYGASTSFLISSGNHVLTVGQIGYVVHTETITIPNTLSYTVTLVQIKITPTAGDVDGDGVPNAVDPDYKGEGLVEPFYKDPMIMGLIIGVIAIITIVAVAIIYMRRKK